jgi:hypothetical protein
MAKPTDVIFIRFLASLPGGVRKDPKKFWARRRDHFVARIEYLEKRSRYSLEVVPNEFRVFDERSLIRELALRGLHYDPQPLAVKPDPHAPKSKPETKEAQKERHKAQVAEVLSQIREKPPVDFIGQLSGYPPGLHEGNKVNGHRLLITRSVEIPEAVKGNCQGYEKLVHSLFPGIQADVVKTQIKYADEIRRGGPPFAPIQVLIIAGGVEHGKTLFAEEVLGGLLGGYADATLYFTSDQPLRFNDELANSAISLLDDQNFPAKMRLQSFLDHLRKHAATTTRRVEAKYSTALNVPLFQWVVMLSNTESHNFDWFPSITGDIADKIHLIQSAKADLPNGKGHRQKIRQMLDDERAAWLHHLRHEYTPPGEILSEGRFGIRPYHHPDLIKGTPGFRRAEELITVLNRYVAEHHRKEQEFTGTAFEYRLELIGTGIPGVAAWTEQTYKTSNILGKDLVVAAALAPDQISVLEGKNHTNLYRFLTREKAQKEKGEILPLRLDSGAAGNFTASASGACREK